MSQIRERSPIPPQGRIPARISQLSDPSNKLGIGEGGHRHFRVVDHNGKSTIILYENNVSPFTGETETKAILRFIADPVGELVPTEEGLSNTDEHDLIHKRARIFTSLGFPNQS